MLGYSGADPGFFLGGGAPLMIDVTNRWEVNTFSNRIQRRRLHVRRGGGGGGAHPLHPPPRSAPIIDLIRYKKLSINRDQWRLFKAILDGRSIQRCFYRFQIWLGSSLKNRRLPSQLKQIEKWNNIRFKPTEYISASSLCFHFGTHREETKFSSYFRCFFFKLIGLKSYENTLLSSLRPVWNLGGSNLTEQS